MKSQYRGTLKTDELIYIVFDILNLVKPALVTTSIKLQSNLL
jgi:hypothetical protein